MRTAPIAALGLSGAYVDAREAASEPSEPACSERPAAMPDAAVGGYVVARESGIRPLGGVVLGAAGLYAGRSWVAKAGGAGAAGLATVYLGGFGASHVLAKKIGAWPAVLAVAAVALPLPGSSPTALAE